VLELAPVLLTHKTWYTRCTRAYSIEARKPATIDPPDGMEQLGAGVEKALAHNVALSKDNTYLMDIASIHRIPSHSNSNIFTSFSLCEMTNTHIQNRPEVFSRYILDVTRGDFTHMNAQAMFRSAARLMRWLQDQRSPRFHCDRPQD
jgi:hypothetical protein